MAVKDQSYMKSEQNSGSTYLKSFQIKDTFGRDRTSVEFPSVTGQKTETRILILSGLNGTGKTTILRMIEGMLSLNFDIFRRFPFGNAVLEFSTNHKLSVCRTSDEDWPLEVMFGENFEHKARLPKSRQLYENIPAELDIQRKIFRESALKITESIHFELLDIHRSLPLRYSDSIGLPRHLINRRTLNYQELQIIEGNNAVKENVNTLSDKVKAFLREAQVNYRRFFSADELELLPRIVDKFDSPFPSPSRESLLKRVRSERDRAKTLRRFGLQTDDKDIESLIAVLSNRKIENNANALTFLEAYVETQENRGQARELISRRLVEFENIMEEFLIDKKIKVDVSEGLTIKTQDGSLKETELSSGEYHFLYMMVSALLCQRFGTIIAIDEPELSLHVSWQRKLIKALTRCAAGASPLFLFATHSIAIQAEYKDKVVKLSEIE